MRPLIALLALLWSLAANSGVSTWVPFDSDGGHIVIPAILNGIQTHAILDSGASGNGVSDRFLQQHEGEYSYGKQVVVRGIAGTRKVRLVDDISIGMFGTEFKIDKLMPVRIRTADLIVGLSFFNNFVLQIDYPNSRLRIITHDVLDLRKFDNVRMKKSANARHPIVRVTMNDEADLWLTLDTGNSTGILIPRRSASRFDWLKKYTTTQARVGGVTKVIDIEQFSIPEFTIGPFTLENVTVIVPGEGEKTNVGKESAGRTGSRLKQADSDGILGFDVLQHFIVTIDYKRSLLNLELPQE